MLRLEFVSGLNHRQVVLVCLWHWPRTTALVTASRTNLFSSRVVLKGDISQNVDVLKS